MTAPTTGLLHDKKIGIIGAGAMGSALCRGLVSSGVAQPGSIMISDPHAGHLNNLAGTLSVQTSSSNSDVARFGDIIILAVKPMTIDPVLSEVRELLLPHQLVISVAAGIHVTSIEHGLANPVPVIRAMPNTAAQVNEGACAFCRGTHTTPEHVSFAEQIFQSVGTAILVDERMMDAVTALSGSGPAYVYLMIEALIDGGVKAGLPRDMAHQLACQTVLGAAKMVIETQRHPAQLKDMVATPSGTTITALAALEHAGFRAALIDAVERAALRSAELGR